MERGERLDCTGVSVPCYEGGYLGGEEREEGRGGEGVCGGGMVGGGGGGWGCGLRSGVWAGGVDGLDGGEGAVGVVGGCVG